MAGTPALFVLQLVDKETGPWAHIRLDHFVAAGKKQFDVQQPLAFSREARLDGAASLRDAMNIGKTLLRIVECRPFPPNRRPMN